MSGKTKVLHIITSLDADGAQNMLLKLCQYAAKNPCLEFKIINLRVPTPFAERFDALNVEVIHLNMLRMLPSLRALQKIRSIIRAYKPDLIQGWMYHGNLAATAAQWLSGSAAPVIWNIRKATEIGDYRPLTRLTIRLGALLSTQAARVIYCGNYIATQHLALGFSRTNQVTIANGFDTDIFSPSPANYAKLRSDLKLEPNTPIVGMTARYHRHKDHPNFLRAAAFAAEADSTIHFVLAGRGLTDSNREIVTIAEDLGIRSRLHLLDERSDVSGLISGFDVYCQSSAAEGFPNALGEAMSCGVPCVTTDVGAAAEVVGNCGVIVPAEDSDSLGRGILRLMQLTKAEREELGFQSRRRIVKRFSLPAIGSQYEELYYSCLPSQATRCGQAPNLASIS